MSTIHASQLLTSRGWKSSTRLHVEAGFITAVEPDVPPQAGDERHAVIVPALPNLHSHAFQRGMAGLAETRGSSRDDFWSWRETMYRFASNMSPPQLEAVASQAYMEMLETGFCRVGEFHYLHHDLAGRPYADVGEMSGRIAAAACATGIGLTLLPVFYAHASFGGAPPRDNQKRFILDVDAYARLIQRCATLLADLPQARLGVAPHSLRAVTPQQMASVLEIARGIGAHAPVHIHIAEQSAEVRDCIAWSGQRPVRWLLDHFEVDSRWCLVHATHVDDGELSDIATTGATVGLCPITEANLGDGIFPAAGFIARNGSLGIGSDSNVHINCAAELALLEYSQRLSLQTRNVIGGPEENTSTGRALFTRARAGGSMALGTAGTALVEGAPADMLSLAADHPALVCRNEDALLDSWIFAGAQGAVDCVWVAGRKLVENGRHVRRDEILRGYRQAMEELCA